MRMKIAVAAISLLPMLGSMAATPEIHHVRTGTQRIIRVAEVRNLCALMRRFEITHTGPQFITIVPHQRGGVHLSPNETVGVDLDVNARAFVPAGLYSADVTVRCVLCGPEANCRQDRFVIPVRVQVYDRPRYTVTVMLYSGRRNPEFAIQDRSVIESLERLLASAPRDPSFESSTIIPSILGYNGLLVNAVEDDTPLPLPLVIYNTRIEARSDMPDDREFYRDAGAQIETLLLNAALAQRAITPFEFEQIRQQMERK